MWGPQPWERAPCENQHNVAILMHGSVSATGLHMPEHDNPRCPDGRCGHTTRRLQFLRTLRGRMHPPVRLAVQLGAETKIGVLRPTTKIASQAGLGRDHALAPHRHNVALASEGGRPSHNGQLPASPVPSADPALRLLHHRGCLLRCHEPMPVSQLRCAWEGSQQGRHSGHMPRRRRLVQGRLAIRILQHAVCPLLQPARGSAAAVAGTDAAAASTLRIPQAPVPPRHDTTPSCGPGSSGWRAWCPRAPPPPPGPKGPPTHSNSTTSRCPANAARCKLVPPPLVAASTAAPDCSSSLTQSTCPALPQARGGQQAPSPDRLLSSPPPPGWPQGSAAPTTAAAACALVHAPLQPDPAPTGLGVPPGRPVMPSRGLREGRAPSHLAA